MRMQSKLAAKIVLSALLTAPLTVGLGAVAASASVKADTAKLPSSGAIAGGDTYRCGFYKQDCIDVRNAMADSGYTVGPIIYYPVSGYSFDYWW